MTRSPSWTLLLFSGPDNRHGDEADALATAAQNRVGDRMTIDAVERQHGAEPGRVTGAETLPDMLGLARARYGAISPAVHLLRPDTAVAARGPTDGSADLLRHVGPVFA